jgi:hypothetical protein
VDQDHGGPVTANANMNLGAVGRDGRGSKAGGERLELGTGRSSRREQNGKRSCAHGRLLSSRVSTSDGKYYRLIDL